MERRTADECPNLVESPFLQDLSSNKLGIPEAEEEMNMGKKNCSMDVFPSLTCYLQNHVCSDLSSTEEDVCPATLSPDRDSSNNSSISDESLDDLVIGCQTPRESIFDPFAPAPDGLARAPKKKAITGGRVPLRRRLNFDTDEDIPEMLHHPDNYVFKGVSEDDSLLQYLCKSFFDLIISNQFDEISLELPSHPQDSGTPRTPKCRDLLSGVAETCPPAPPRTSARSRMLCQDICRKLDFGAGSV